MKSKHFFSYAVLCITMAGCGVEQLVATNNELTGKLRQQNDTLIGELRALRDTVRILSLADRAPEMAKLSQMSLSNFYYGDIVKEETLEQRGKWRKLRLTEKIKLQNGETVLKQRSGWYFFGTPETIYLADAQTSLDASFSEPLAETDINRYQVARILFTGKTDFLDQKGLDLLLADRAMNFDGLRFDAKRLDYANLALGSYRGTVFNNCNLSNVSGRRDVITTDHDFQKTRIEAGTNKDMSFSFWKFRDVLFYNTSIENSNFSNCLFTSEGNGLVSFNTVNLKNVQFSHTADGYFKNIVHSNTSFESCRFDDAKFYGTLHFNTRFTACNFYNNLWQGVSFNNTQVSPSRITGGYFSKMKIVGGDYSQIRIEAYGGMKPQFSETEIVNAIFTGSTIEAWFKENCKINGLNDFSRVNFTSSIFEDTTFGSTAQGMRFNLKNANFSGVEFRSNVKFIKCDLTGAIWPANVSNVQFIDCIGR